MPRHLFVLLALLATAGCATTSSPSRPTPADEVESVQGELWRANSTDGCPGDTRPVLLTGKTPEYTAEAMMNRVQGVSKIACVIDVDGLAKRCQVLQSLGMMDAPILAALKTQRYRPAVVCGKPMAMAYTLTMRVGFQQ